MLFTWRKSRELENAYVRERRRLGCSHGESSLPIPTASLVIRDAQGDYPGAGEEQV